MTKIMYTTINAKVVVIITIVTRCNPSKKVFR